MNVAKFVLECVDDIVAQRTDRPPQGLERQRLDVSGSQRWYLNNGFAPGSHLGVKGTVHRNANRFNLDFVCEGGRTIALHFNPRFPEQIVVRNSMTRSNWNEEERKGKFPFLRGSEFSIHFVSQRDCILVLVNHEVYTYFEHRHYPEDITHLELQGDASLSQALYFSRRTSTGKIQRSLIRDLNFKVMDVKYNKCFLDNGFLPGTRIWISGSVYKAADRFAVNLICEGTTHIALHFNPRFSHRVVVRNTQTRGNWDEEERDGGFPFSRGSDFTIEILCQEDCFLILVDKVMFTRFEHRHKPEIITHLEVNGDASLEDAYFYPKKGTRQEPAQQSPQASPYQPASAPPPHIHPSALSYPTNTPYHPSESVVYPSTNVNAVYAQPSYPSPHMSPYPTPQPSPYPPSQHSFYPGTYPSPQLNHQASYPASNPPQFNPPLQQTLSVVTNPQSQQTPYPQTNPQFNPSTQQTLYPSTNPPHFNPSPQETPYPQTNPQYNPLSQQSPYPVINPLPQQAPSPPTNPPQLNPPPQQQIYPSINSANPPQFSLQSYQPSYPPTNPQLNSSLQHPSVGQIQKSFNQGSPTVKPVYPFDPECDANVLRKSLKGIGNDEKTIIQMLTKRTNAQRMEIARQYKALCGKDLSSKLKSELSGSLAELLVALMTPIAEFKAKELHDQISGSNTDNTTLVELLCTATSHEILAMRSAYEIMYHTNLENDLKTTTSGSFRRLLITLSQGQRSTEDQIVNYQAAAVDAQALSNAENLQLTTDESTFLTILCSRSFPQMAQVLAEYQRLTGKELEKTIKEEFSGDIEAGLLAIIKSARNRAGFFAEQLRNAMKGPNTNSRALIRIVVSRSEIDMKTIKEAFVDKYEKSLEQCIKDQTSGDFKRCLLSLIE